MSGVVPDHDAGDLKLRGQTAFRLDSIGPLSGSGLLSEYASDR